LSRFKKLHTIELLVDTVDDDVTDEHDEHVWITQIAGACSSLRVIGFHFLHQSREPVLWVWHAKGWTRSICGPSPSLWDQSVDALAGQW
jgi:hypothetical protein